MGRVSRMPSSPASTSVRPARDRSGRATREAEDPIVSHAVSALPQPCTTLTLTPPSLSRPQRRSEPLQPSVKTLTHRLSSAGKKKTNIKRDEEERGV